MTLDRHTLNRTVKLEMDFGDARDAADAERIVSEYVLQVVVGANVADSPTRQAALLTAVNTGSRAFLGGVRIVMGDDFELTTRWDRGRQVREVLSEFRNVSFVDALDLERPTMVIGSAPCDGRWPLYPTWEGWTAGVVTSRDERLAEGAEFVLSGVLSGALAVSEAFQWARGYKVAAGRAVGLSLWSPDLDWRDPDAAGRRLFFLPDNFWLLGLGHLGQAYAWALGFLPFATAELARVTVMLQDFDELVDANEATSMLVRNGERGLKTRLVEHQLRRLGLNVRRTDRRFDAYTRRDSTRPAEPQLGLGGLDKLEPRRLLENAGFGYIVDAGIGVGRHEYLGISVHTFPSSHTAQEVFEEPPTQTPDESLLDQPAYIAAVEAALANGEAATHEAARCGLLEIAGKAAGAAFVGAVAAVLVLSELLRILNGGRQFETVNVNLRSPGGVRAYHNPSQGQPDNPGYVDAEDS